MLRLPEEYSSKEGLRKLTQEIQETHTKGHAVIVLAEIAGLGSTGTLIADLLEISTNRTKPDPLAMLTAFMPDKVDFEYEGGYGCPAKLVMNDRRSGWNKW